MEKIKRLGIVSLALFFMLGFSGIVSAKDYKCYLDPAETTLNVGEQVVVSVYFGTIPVAGLSGAGMRLYFNSEVLKVVDHFIGYPHWMTTNWYEEEIYRPDEDDDDITDWVSMEGCTLMGFPTGEVLHATVTFEAIADGYGALSTSEIKPFWPNYCGSFVEEYGCIDDVTDFIGGSITVGGEPFYKNHLGINATTGVDYFPYMERGWAGEPPETIEYYSGVAALSMCAKFLYPAFNKTQDELNEEYGGAGNDNELDCTEIRNGIQSELNLHPGMPYDPYNYTHAAVSEAQGGQDYAIRRFIHWTDYDAGDPDQGYEPNAPSLVPTGGGLNWKVVRGFVTDIDPCPSTWVIPEIVLHGVWMNDPSIEWNYNPSQPPEYTSNPPMGANVFYTGDSFKAVYQALSDGKWHAVNEPPRDLSADDIALMDEELKLARIDYAAGKPNAELSEALNLSKDITPASMSIMIMNVEAIDLKAEEIEEAFKKVDWTEVIPDALWATPGFANVMYTTNFNGTMNVADLDTGEDYDLVIFSQSGKADTASVVLMVDETGVFMQSSWASEDHKYLNEEEALKIAKKALGCPNKMIQPIAIAKDLKPVPVPICDTRDWQTELIWNKEYGQSKFQPIYEVSTPGTTVYVLQDGNYFIEKNLIPIDPEPIAMLPVL